MDDIDALLAERKRIKETLDEGVDLGGLDLYLMDMIEDIDKQLEELGVVRED